MSKNREIERQNLKIALEKNGQTVERYTDQIKILNDPAVNSLLEGILHNEVVHKREIEAEIKRLYG